jgi:hypothetical protein
LKSDMDIMWGVIPNAESMTYGIALALGHFLSTKAFLLGRFGRLTMSSPSDVGKSSGAKINN